MFAYNTDWIKSLLISREAKRWRESGFISQDQYGAIKTAYATPLYTPNLFIRIALYIFTAICVSSLTGFLSLFVSSSGSESMSVLLVVLGTAAVAALEGLIRSRHLYSAGIDDALLYGALGLCLGGILSFLFFSFDNDLPITIPAIISIPFLVAATIRYGDRITTLGAYCCLLFIVGKSMVDAGGTVEALIPFAVMLISIAVYIPCSRAKDKDSAEPWQKCLTILESASLVTFYLGGNYLVVRQLTELLLKLEIPDGKDIPFAWLFYGLTVVIPAAYIIFGLKQRDNILLRTGLLAAVFSVFTFRYYFAIAPPEVALTIGGLLLIAIAVQAIRYLKTPRHGITPEKLLSRKFENLDAEMLVMSQTLGATPSHPSADFKPGGGKFGGGGTSENW